MLKLWARMERQKLNGRTGRHGCTRLGQPLRISSKGWCSWRAARRAAPTVPQWSRRSRPSNALHSSLCTVFLPSSLLRRAHDGFGPVEEFLGSVPEEVEVQHHSNQFAASEGLVIIHVGTFIEYVSSCCSIPKKVLESIVLGLKPF